MSGETSAEPSEPNPEPTNKRPFNTAFKQQRLPAWQPILTAGTVVPFFFVVGIAFIPVGIGLLYFSDEVQEKVIEYTNCESNNTQRDANLRCAELITREPPPGRENPPCYCKINFTLDTDFNGKVYMYYGLSNFYQNHRRYVKSRDDIQLLGQLNEVVSTDCEPFAYDKDHRPVAPCGAIANSLFNDELKIYSYKHKKDVPLLKTGIAWPTDKERKFQNPPIQDGKSLKDAFKGFVKPRNWTKNVWELDLEDPNNNGFKNEDLIVWMRTSALPTFRKLYRRIDHDKDGFRDGLAAGNYTLIIKYAFQVTSFDGKKRMILSTTSLLGGKNPFLGSAYIATGSLTLILGVILLIIHIKYAKSTSELINITPQTPYQ